MENTNCPKNNNCPNQGGLITELKICENEGDINPVKHVKE